PTLGGIRLQLSWLSAELVASLYSDLLAFPLPPSKPVISLPRTIRPRQADLAVTSIPSQCFQLLPEASSFFQKLPDSSKCFLLLPPDPPPTPRRKKVQRAAAEHVADSCRPS